MPSAMSLTPRSCSTASLAAPERPASRPAAPDGRYNTMPDEGVDIAGYLDMVRIYLLTMLDICEAA
jgi:hypothetical protein